MNRHPVLADFDDSSITRLSESRSDIPITKALFLCTDQRTGSQWLCQLVGQTGKLGRPTEYFNTQWMRRFFPSYPEEPEDQYEIAKKISTTKNGVFGMKLHAEHMDKISNKVDLISPFDRKYFVFLYRRDLLGQAISLVRANQTGHWHSEDERTASESYSRGRIIYVIRRLALNRARWFIFLSKYGIEPLEIAYEDLVERYQEILPQIGSHVGEVVERPPDRDDNWHRVQRDETTADWRKRFLEEDEKTVFFPRFELLHDSKEFKELRETHGGLLEENSLLKSEIETLRKELLDMRRAGAQAKE